MSDPRIDPDRVRIELTRPITDGERRITEIVVRAPTMGTLRAASRLRLRLRREFAAEFAGHDLDEIIDRMRAAAEGGCDAPPLTRTEAEIVQVWSMDSAIKIGAIMTGEPERVLEALCPDDAAALAGAVADFS
jgi:hypothetical protein